MHGAKALPLLTLLAGAVHAAEVNDELLVDPTQPLNLEMAIEAQGDNSGDGGGGFDLFGVFTSYELSSVLIRAGDRLAVVNGERVRVGDSVGAARITAIEADHVTLNVNGKIETLELYGDSIKTLVKGDE